MNIDDFEDYGKNSLLDLKRKALLRKANGKSFIVVFSIYSVVIFLFILIIRTHYTNKKLQADNFDLRYDLDWKTVDSASLAKNIEILQLENKEKQKKYKEITNFSIEYMTSLQNIKGDLVNKHSKFDSLIKRRDDIMTELAELQKTNEYLMEELRKAKVINADIS